MLRWRTIKFMAANFQPLETQGTTDAVLRRIAAAISQGHFMPSDRLPSERDLAAQLGVSRQTARNAVRVLAEAGVVTVISGQGAGSGARVLSNYVPLDLVGADRPQPDFREVASVLEARRLLEPNVAVLAGFKMIDEDYDAMHEVIELQKAASDLEGIRSLDIRFHLAIAAAAHNRVITALMQDLMQRLDVARHVVSVDSETEARETIDIHERTLEAILSRDSERTERVMDEHLGMLEDAWELASSRALPRYLSPHHDEARLFPHRAKRATVPAVARVTT